MPEPIDQFVLIIKGDKVAGLYNTYEEALKAADSWARAEPIEPFRIRHIKIVPQMGSFIGDLTP